jgi:hypothetical protein
MRWCLHRGVKCFGNLALRTSGWLVCQIRGRKSIAVLTAGALPLLVGSGESSVFGDGGEADFYVLVFGMDII